jgi:hypothetical protein
MQQAPQSSPHPVLQRLLSLTYQARKYGVPQEDAGLLACSIVLCYLQYLPLHLPVHYSTRSCCPNSSDSLKSLH